MGDDEQGEEESVKLQRMLSSLIADKRKMFDLLTKILDRGKKDKDAALVQYVEQATGLCRSTVYVARSATVYVEQRTMLHVWETGSMLRMAQRV